MASKCRVCGKAPKKFRGQCSACYQGTLPFIRAGEWNWPDLEAEGLADPPKKRGRPASRRALLKRRKR